LSNNIQRKEFVNIKNHILIGLNLFFNDAKTSIQIFFVFFEVSETQDIPSDDFWRIPSLFILKNKLLEIVLIFFFFFCAGSNG